MKKIIAVFLLVMFLATSGCATFSGNQLLKQSVKPQKMNEACLVSEQVFYGESAFKSEVSGLGLTSKEYLAPFLRQVIVDAQGTFIPVFQEAVDARMARFNALLDHDKRVLICSSATYIKETIGGVVRESFNYEDLTGDMPIERVVAIYKARVVEEESNILANKMRTDIKFREQILSPGIVWLDCKTFVSQRNPSAVMLGGLLCVFTGSLIPSNITTDISMKISSYVNEKTYEHEYKDSYNCVVWLPLFPIGLTQGWPDSKTIISVVNNVAVTAVIDFQKDQATR